MKKKYDVVGMTCSACSAHVDKAVRGLDGVDDINVNLLQNSMTVEFDENWKNGVLRAFQDFTVDADNTAGTAEQVFSSAFSNMGNGLATFVTTGKLNFKSFTSSVLSDTPSSARSMMM